MLVLPDRLERRKTARKTQIIYCFEVHDPGDPFRRDAIDANSVSNRIPIISNPIHWSKTSRRAKHCKTIMLINSNKKAPLILPCCSPLFAGHFLARGKPRVARYHQWLHPVSGCPPVLSVSWSDHLPTTSQRWLLELPGWSSKWSKSKRRKWMKMIEKMIIVEWKMFSWMIIFSFSKLI